jgi:uncharacterized protein (TIGR03435 family)
MFVALFASQVILAQPAEQQAAFEVASIKPNKSGDPAGRANFPLGPGDVFTPAHGVFSAQNLPLFTYISFAYRIQGNQERSLRSQLPDWVTAEHFDIEARALGNPTKDQMRLMMRSLLADRFKLAIHLESKQIPIFALLLARSGTTGPRFRPHPDDGSCSGNPPPKEGEMSGQFPALCGGLLRVPPSTPGLHSWGARNVTLPFIANQLTAMGALDRPVFDQTGLSGTFDFALEWADEPADTNDVPAGATFLQAIREQLGMKLESQRSSVEVIVLDHVEHPSEN